MLAAILHHPGPPDQLRLEERPVPTPTAGQVLLRVRAFGLNRSELMTRKGLSPGVRLPRILGIECVGEVVEDPSDEYAPGQQVAALMGGLGRDFDGSYAEYTVVPKTILYPFRSRLPWALLGAIPELFQTVYGSLHLALGIQPGQTLLVRGGTSSVGLLAAQLASQAGLTVLATSRRADRADLLQANGATHALVDDGHLQAQVRALYPQGVDRALELVGTTTLRNTLACLRPGGLGCMTGMLAESWAIPDFAPMEFIPATVGLTTYDSGQLTAPAAALQAFIDSVEAGRVHLGLGRTFALADIGAAHELTERNAAGGKLVVTTYYFPFFLTPNLMNTPEKTAVVTGANSGIGLALTQKLLAEGYRVIGTSRSGQIADFSHPNLTVVTLDVTNDASIAQAVAQIGQLAPSLDLLVNNAGVGFDLGTIAPERKSLRDTFATNVDGTMLFTEPMLPLVRDGGQIVFLSSKMGLPAFAAPDSPAYRISKAAINMYAAILAQRVAGRSIVVTPMHPGWVQTRMGGDSAPFTVEQSAAGLFRGIEARPESGKFWNIETDSLVA